MLTTSTLHQGLDKRREDCVRLTKEDRLCWNEKAMQDFNIGLSLKKNFYTS